MTLKVGQELVDLSTAIHKFLEKNPDLVDPFKLLVGKLCQAQLTGVGFKDFLEWMKAGLHQVNTFVRSERFKSLDAETAKIVWQDIVEYSKSQLWVYDSSAQKPFSSSVTSNKPDRVPELLPSSGPPLGVTNTQPQKEEVPF